MESAHNSDIDFVVEFETDPSRYRHWRVSYAGPVAHVEMCVDPEGGVKPGYELKLNSYDLGVDIELADIVRRMRFEHPEKEWRRAELAPLLNPLNSTHARGRPVRTHGREFDRLELARAGVTLTLPLEQYWARIEEVVTAELLACERDVARDRDAFFAGHMEGGKGVEA